MFILDIIDDDDDEHKGPLVVYLVLTLTVKLVHKAGVKVMHPFLFLFN